MDTKSSQQLLLDIEKKNRRYKFFVICSIATFFVFAGLMLSIGLKTIEAQKKTINEIRSTQIANKEDNTNRQENLKSYVKCLALSRFDVPAQQLLTRQGVLDALDKCSKLE